jgi:hypothetical protein
MYSSGGDAGGYYRYYCVMNTGALCESLFLWYIQYVLFNSALSFVVRSVLGPKKLIYFFMNNIFNLKGSCVLCTLKKSFAIF